MHKHPSSGELVWHGIDAHFGDTVSYESILKIITDHKRAFSSNVVAQLHYNESYDKLFGIYDHDKNPNNLPMPEVAIHWTEDVSEDSPLYESITSFIDNNVAKYTNMSYDKFLELPSDLVRFITEKCIDRAQREADMQQQILEAANAARAAQQQKPNR